VRRALLLLLMAAPLAALIAGQLSAFSGHTPTDIGVTGERLKPPSATRNSVSSQANLYPEHPQRVYAEIAPLALRGDTPDAALQALVSVLASQPGITVIEQTPDYVYAQARTRWLGFVDDLEFWVNRNSGVIEMRSASRLGREDLGANRQRIEAIRTVYLNR
jgi:uncharacterized protein (DUF1499 family)